MAEKKEDSEKDFLKAKELISLAEKMYFSKEESEQGEIADIKEYVESFENGNSENKTEKVIDFQKIISLVQEISGGNQEIWIKNKNLKISEITDGEVKNRIMAMAEKLQKPTPAEDEKIITWIVRLYSKSEEGASVSRDDKVVKLDEIFLDPKLTPDQKKELEIFFQETFKRTFMTETFAFLDSEDRQVLEKMVKEKAEFKKINDFLELKLEDYAKIKEKAKRLLDQEMGNVFQNL